MFTMKKPVIILVLVVLLVFLGYANHNLTKQSMLKASNDYQRHEEMEITEKIDEDDDKDLVETISEGESEEDIEVIDTKNEKEVDGLMDETNNAIETTMSKEDSLKSKNYFIEQRLSRDKLRGGLVDRLNEIVNNANTNNEIKSDAQKKIMRLGDISEKELIIEGLTKAKGFEEVLVLLTDENAKIVVFKDELTEQDTVKILDIVMGETDLNASNIKIMKKN